MILALLLALAGLATVAYGWSADQAAALCAGFFAVLCALGLWQLPIRCTEDDEAPDDEAPEGELLDLAGVEFDWPDRRAA